MPINKTVNETGSGKAEKLVQEGKTFSKLYKP